MEQESVTTVATKPQLLSPSCLPTGARGSRKRPQAGPEVEPCKRQPWLGLGGHMSVPTLAGQTPPGLP